MSASGLRRDTLALLVSNIGSAALLFALYGLIGRGTGERGLGVYSAALALVYPVSLLVEFGLATLATRHAADAPHTSAVLLARLALARLVMGGAACLVLLLLADIISPDAETGAGVRLSAPLVIILPLFTGFTAVLKARGAAVALPWLNLGMLAAQVALTWTGLRLGAGTDVLLALNTVTSAGQLVAAWAWWRWLARRDPVVAAWAGWRETYALIVQASPFAWAGVFAAVQARLGVLLVAHLAGAAAAGMFAAAWRFSEAARLVPGAYFGALFPALARLRADPPALRRMFRRAQTALALYGAAGVLGAALFGASALHLVYGDSFAPAAPVLRVLMIGLTCSLMRGGATLYAYARDGERAVNTINAAALLVQAAAGVPLIAAWGMIGAAWSVVAAEGLALILLGWTNAHRDRHTGF